MSSKKGFSPDLELDPDQDPNKRKSVNIMAWEVQVNTKILTISLFQTLIHLSRKYGKKYCYPSQDKIVELLKKYHKVELSRRSLNRWLRYLEDEGYFERKRRITMGDDGRFHFKSTIYIIKGKMFRLAYKFSSLFEHMPFWKNAGDDVAGRRKDLDPKNRLSREEFLAGMKTVKAAIAGD
jgi:hypothetical protein